MSGMEHLPDDVLKFLAAEPAAVLALPIDETGGIHAAPLIFWMDPETYHLFFVTGRQTDKCGLLINKNRVQASCVIGTSKGTPFCLQMRGHAIIADPAAFRPQIAGYYEKRGNRNDNIDDPDTVLLAFEPDWIRVTDYTGAEVARKELSRT